MKNTQPEIKRIKIGKRPGTTYCLGCEDLTHKFRPQEVKITNKMLRGKSNFALCQSRLSKQKHNNKK